MNFIEEKIIEKILKNDDYGEKSIAMGTEYVNNYFSNQGTASQSILNFLTKLSSN